MTAPNIKRFDQSCGLIFAYLYSHFPRRVLLTSGILDIVFEDAKTEISSSDWLAQFATQEVFFSSTMEWLVEADYLRVSKATTNGVRKEYYGCVLTAKALEAMKSMPESLTGDTMLSAAGDLAKGIGLDTAKSLGGRVIEAGLGIAFAAAAATLRS